jgi:DNA polymerase-3 subunit beta
MYPDWRQVLPKDRKGGMTVKSSALLETTRRVGLVAANKVLTLQLAPSSLRVEATDPDRGDAKEAVEVRYEGAAAKIGINGRFLADAVQGAEADEVAVTFGADVGMEAIEVRPVGQEGFLAVIMPCRI